MANSSANEPGAEKLLEKWLRETVAQRADALDADPARALTGADLRKRLFATGDRKPVEDR